jgi:hypothetical protein
MESQRPPHGIRTRKRCDLGLASLLSVFSWFGLTALWIHSAKGGLIDRFVGAFFFLPYGLGKHMAHVLFPDRGPDHAIRNSTGYFLGPLLGVAGEILLLLLFWFVGLRIVRSLWTKFNSQ